MAKKFDWKKTAKKVLIVSAEVLVLGLLAWITEHHEFLYLVPALEGARNILKHRSKS